jgi:acetyl esterase/lipase
MLYPMPLLFRLLAVLGFTVAVGRAADAYPPSFEGARAEVYKEVGDVKLSLYIFEPTSGPKTNRPAMVFFFGGGWTSGNPKQFEQHCRHLAERGMVAITADYRVASRHGVKPVTCVTDAKSAIRWVRQQAQRLGIDPNRVAAGGGSAGGHLAAATATLSGFDESGEDRSISAIPNALVLYNPALIMAPMAGVSLEGFESRVSADRMGTDPVKLSPAHHVKKGAPPTIIFHGKADTTVPYATAEAFTREMQKAGSRCELVGFDGQPHGFFNYGRGDNRNYRATLAATDAFLVSLGYLAKTSGD